MTKSIKGIIIIIIVIILMIIGIIVISNMELSNEPGTIEESPISQKDDLEIRVQDKPTISPTTKITVTTTPTITPTVEPAIELTPEPVATATEAPLATPAVTPPVPESNSDDAQISVASSMNGYIYVSYKSEKKVKVMMDCGGKSEVYDLVADGKFHRFTLHLGDGEYLIRVVENTTGKSYRPIKSEKFECKMINQKFPYLFSNTFVVYNNDMECISFGLELTKDADTNKEKARAIYDWIVRNVKYDFSVLGKLEPGYVPNPQKTFETKLGICSDYASLFASMCRSQGIPCKVVLGYYEKSEYYHAWNEVYFDGDYHIVDTSGDSQTEQYDFTRTDGYKTNKEH